MENVNSNYVVCTYLSCSLLVLLTQPIIPSNRDFATCKPKPFAEMHKGIIHPCSLFIRYFQELNATVYVCSVLCESSLTNSGSLKCLIGALQVLSLPCLSLRPSRLWITLSTMFAQGTRRPPGAVGQLSRLCAARKWVH